MANIHYDVIILGESLAARIAAVLLAKAGRRVLAVCSRSSLSSAPAWIPVSLHLERLLELLGGRSCLTTAHPFQVISGDVRLTMHGLAARLDEVQREFPEDSTRVLALLRELEETGDHLETVLWESGGLPLTGWASRWRFFRKRLGKGLTRGGLFRPLSEKLQECGSAQTVQALSALFSGLSLCPSGELTVAEAALLWRSFGDNRGVSTASLNALLTHRFEQSNGMQIELNDLKELPSATGRRHEIVLKNGQTFSASHFLLGSSLVSEKFHDTEPSLTFPAFHFSIIKGSVSPLLAQVVILDGSPPLRLTLGLDSATRRPRVICQPAITPGDIAASHCEERLAAMFPFATLVPEPVADTAALPAERLRRTKAFPGAVRSHLGEQNLLYCCGERILPTLGAVGEVIIAFSVFNHLQRELRS